MPPATENPPAQKAAPQQKAASQSSPSASPASPPPSEESFDVMSEIDSLASGISKPDTKEPEKSKAEESAENLNNPPPDTNEGKVTEPKPEPKPAEKKPDNLGSAKELRAAYDKAQSEIRAMREELEKVRTSKPPEDPEKKTLAESLEAEKKRREELEGVVKFTDYTRSDEYKERYHQPLVDAFESAFTEVKSLPVVGEDGQKVREGTEEDFNRIVRLPTPEAINESKRLFGEAHTEVMAHRRKIQDLNRSREKAINDYYQKGTEREKQKAAESLAAAERQKSAYESTIKTLSEKHPALFSPKEGDQTEAEILSKGNRVADEALNPSMNLPPEKRAEINAIVRMKAGAYDLTISRLQSAAKRISELEEEIKKMQESEPGSGEESADTQKVLTIDDEIDAAASSSKK